MIDPQTERAIGALREYLNRLGFVQMYKYIASVNLYHVNPHIPSRFNKPTILNFDNWLEGDRRDLALALCLCVDQEVALQDLDDYQRSVADALLEADLIGRDGDTLRMGPYQLISVQDLPLLVDAKVNFPEPETHNVYFGPDSLLLSFYVDTANISRTDPVLDLGTGSGLLGLFLSRFSDRVTVTDIAPAPLRLVRLNRLLNQKEDSIRVVTERYAETLKKGERYKAVTFNPPFVALPQELEAPVFAKGPGEDGLDYCRLLIQQFDDVVLPDGTAYVVADLLGTLDGANFVRDLAGYAEQGNLSIDVYQDGRNDYTDDGPGFHILATYLQRENPKLTYEETYKRVEELHRKTNAADCSYLSVMVVRRRPWLSPGVRVFNRFKKIPFGGGNQETSADG